MKPGQPRRPLAGSHRRPGCSGSSSGARCRPPSRARQSDPSGWPNLQPPPEQPRSPSALPGQPAGGHGAIAPRPLGERRAWVAAAPHSPAPTARSHSRLLSSDGGGKRGGSRSAPPLPPPALSRAWGAPLHHSPSALPPRAPASPPRPTQKRGAAGPPLHVYIYLGRTGEAAVGWTRLEKKRPQAELLRSEAGGSLPSACSDAALHLHRLVQKCRCLRKRNGRAKRLGSGRTLAAAWRVNRGHTCKIYPQQHDYL